MIMDYGKYLETRLAQAKNQTDVLSEEECDPAVLLANINGVRNILFEVLDYSVNHFSSKVLNFSNIYFPILKPREEKSDLSKNSHFIRISKLNDKGLEEYIMESYDIILNLKNEGCLLLLTSCTKHRNADSIIDKSPGIKAEIEGTGEFPIEQDIYGGYNIGNIIKTGPGCNVKMSNCVSVNSSGTTIINSLETVLIKRNSLVIQVGDQSIPVLIKPFLTKCINCCNEIVKL